MPITTEPAPNSPPAGTVRLQFFGQCNGAPWSNGFWLLTTGTPAPGDLSDLATDCYGVYQTTFLGLMSDQSHLTECKVTYYTEVGSIPAEVFADHAGPHGDQLLAAGTAAVVSWAIEPTYRGGKPRTYLAGMTVDHFETSRTWDNDYVGGLTDQGAAFLSGINGLAPGDITTVTLGVVHFFSGGVALDPPTFDPYVGASGQKRMCSQRRRLGPEI